MPQTLIASSPDQATLPIRVHRLSKGVPTDRQDGPDVSTGVVPAIDGEHPLGSYILPLTSLSPCVESLVII